MASRSELITATTIVVLTVLILAGLVRLLFLVGEILVLVLMAAILAAGLSPLVDRLQRRSWGRRRRHISRQAAIAITYIGLIAMLGLLGSVVIAPVVSETQQFIQKAPDLYRGLQTMLGDLKQRYPWMPDLSAILGRLPKEAGQLTDYIGAATGVAFRVFGAVVSAITVLILSLYMLLEGPAIKEGFLALVPRRHHRQLETVLQHVGLKFGGWLRGQLLLGFILGVAAGFGTWILGLPYPFLLGVAAGVTELIPLIGPVLGAVPAVLIALFGPLWRLVAVIAFYTAIQQTEGNYLVPRVMKQAVGLSPLLTIIAIMVGANLMGILGALLAVPVAAALQVVVGEVLRTFRATD